MKTFVKQITWLCFGNHGWGNGYVIIPKNHPLYGVDYDEINNHVHVHGGLTFSHEVSDLNWDEIPENIKEGWVVGFDTCHFNDSISEWSKSAVEKETMRLKKQIINYKP